MAAGESAPDRVRGAGDVERTAAVVERIRQNLLMALRESYSIVIMASLSLVIAAFSQNVAPEAVPYAVGAATAFLVAVVLTILHEIRRSARAVVHIEIGSATVVAIVAGLALLGVVIAKFAQLPRFEVTLRIIAMVLGSITLVAFGTLWLRMHEAVDRLQRDPGIGPRRGPTLRIVSWVAVAGWGVLAGTLALTVAGLGYPGWIVAVGFIAFLVPVAYVLRIDRGFMGPRMG